jgi:hypothetical protein
VARQTLDDIALKEARGSLSREALQRNYEALARMYPETRAGREAQERLDALAALSTPPVPPPATPDPTPISVQPPTPQPPPTPAPPVAGPGSVDNPERWKSAVDLMPLVDPRRDAVAGTWSKANGELVSDQAGDARIEVPFRPPEEYDYRVRFARRAGSGDVLQILSACGRHFVWQMAGSNNTVFGFALVRGQRVANNATTIRRPACFENGRVYTSTVQVRKDGVAAYVDGQRLAAWRTSDFQDMDIYHVWKMRDATALGLATCGSSYAIQRVELLEVTGKGRRK